MPLTTTIPESAAGRGDGLRILMVAPTSFFSDYGCHVRILEEARILQRMGHAVTIVTYHNGNDVPGILVERTLPIPYRATYEVGSSRHKIAFDLLLGVKILQLLGAHRYDIIHGHLHEGALMALSLGRLFGIPAVFDFQGSLTGEMLDHNFLRPGGLRHRLFRSIESWVDRRSPFIFTSTVQAERLLVNEFHCDPAQVVTLPDCVNAQDFRPAADVDPAALAALRSRLGIPVHHRVIVYLGLLAEYQGTTHLLEAMVLLRERYPDVTLLLMGFPNINLYRAKAVDLGVADRVIFTGRVPYAEAPLHLALGDVAVAPKLSLTEGAGKLLNYMAVGLPIVAFDTPVAREYLGDDGLLAERGNSRALADSIDALLADPGRAVAQGEQLRRRAVQHFDWWQAGVRIVETYRKLLPPAPAKPATAAVNAPVHPGSSRT